MTAVRLQVDHLIDTHPSVEALARVLAEPDVARDELAVDSWIAGAIHRRLGRLRSAVEFNRTTAPTIGVMGTVTGMAIAIAAYGQNPDQGQLLFAIGLSMVKTLMAGIVTLIEGRTLDRRLVPLELELSLHAQGIVARARAYLARPGHSPEVPVLARVRAACSQRWEVDAAPVGTAPGW